MEIEKWKIIEHLIPNIFERRKQMGILQLYRGQVVSKNHNKVDNETMIMKE